MNNLQPPAPSKAAIWAWQCILVLCAVIALSIIPFLDENLLHFKDRIIGVTTLGGIDPEYRNKVYILGVIAAISLSTCLFLAMKWSQTFRSLVTHNESTLFITAFAAILNLTAYAIKGESLFLGAATLAAILIVLNLGWQYAFSAKEHSQDKERYLVLCIALGWQCATSIFMLAQLQLHWPFLLTFALISAAFLLLGEKWKPAFSRQATWTQSPVVVWLGALPLLYIASNELAHFRFNAEAQIAPQWIFAALSTATLLVASCRKHASMRSLYWLCAFVLISEIAINEYQNTIEYPRSYDLFHLGERVLPLQQWGSFSSLPFVDYLPIHGLFDALPHFVYQQLTGASALESLIWGNGYFSGWLMRAISILILFHFMSRLIDVKLAFFLLWLLPTYHYLEPYFCLMLLPAIHITYFPTSTSSQRWWITQWLLTLALFLWRLDFGAVTCVANFSIAIAYAWYTKSTRPFMQCLMGSILVGCVAAVSALILAQEHSLTDLAVQLKSYLTNQTILTSYARFYKELNAATVIHYLIFPASAAIIAGASLSRVLQRSTPRSGIALELLLIFICALTLMMSLRSMHRHSILEGTAKNYLFLVAILVFLIQHQSRALIQSRIATPALLMTIVMGVYLFLPSGELYGYKKALKRTAAWEYPISTNGTTLPSWDHETSRLNDTVTKYDNVLSLTQQLLNDGQSFYDFANAPMLYALADVKLPVYIFETLYQTSDTLQTYTIDQVEKARVQDKIPFVVFRQNTHWDKLDGVDNALRSFLIAEYIYQHYQPCMRVDDFDLWIEKHRASSSDCQNKLSDAYHLSEEVTDAASFLPMNYLKQFINFGAVPYLWATFDTTEESIASTTKIRPKRQQDKRWGLELANKKSECLDSACYLDLVIKSERNGKVTAFFNRQKQFKMTVLEGEHSYRVRMSVLWQWHQLHRLGAIRLESDTPFSVTSAKLTSLAAN